MEFKHINDCWNYLREAATLEELEERIGDLPNKFGSWYIEKNEWGECRVINSYYDNYMEDMVENIEDLDINYEEEVEDEEI